jgi:hypothetical protein
VTPQAGPDPAARHGGPDAGWYLRTMGGWRRISDTEAANERYEGMRHFMHDPDEDDRPASMLRPVDFALDDDEAELKRVPTRPATEADEAEDAW